MKTREEIEARIEDIEAKMTYSYGSIRQYQAETIERLKQLLEDLYD